MTAAGAAGPRPCALHSAWNPCCELCSCCARLAPLPEAVAVSFPMFWSRIGALPRRSTARHWCSRTHLDCHP